jgi:hypothetical protein
MHQAPLARLRERGGGEGDSNWRNARIHDSIEKGANKVPSPPTKISSGAGSSRGGSWILRPALPLRSTQDDAALRAE